MIQADKQQAILLNFIMNKKWSLVRHIIMLIPLASVFIPTIHPDTPKKIANFDQVISAVYQHGVFMFILSVFIIYTNLIVLIPKLLFKNRYFFYAVSVLFMGVLYYLGEYFHGNYVYKGFEANIDVPGLNIKDFIDNILLPLIFLGATTGYKVFKKWVIDTQRINELQKAQLQQELVHLKNQVNPHFLFNTLNNLHTLNKTDPDKASQVILGLSDVLRYQIYDSTKETVLLSKDMEMINYYLLLEKIRRENFNYEIIINGDINGKIIPPLLFINFIDNALKHGADTRDSSFLQLEFNMRESNHLIFTSKNSKPTIINQKQNGGLGLKNIKRRLELLYGENYQLKIDDKPNLYTVTLQLPI